MHEFLFGVSDFHNALRHGLVSRVRWHVVHHIVKLQLFHQGSKHAFLEHGHTRFNPKGMLVQRLNGNHIHMEYGHEGLTVQQGIEEDINQVYDQGVGQTRSMFALHTCDMLHIAEEDGDGMLGFRTVVQSIAIACANEVAAFQVGGVLFFVPQCQAFIRAYRPAVVAVATHKCVDPFAFA
jgi:hypothetical protein